MQNMPQSLQDSHIVIVTGLSGSGKTIAIKVLEDIGFFCVDNLPLGLFDKFLTLIESHEDVRRVALGIDVRERVFLDSFSGVLNSARSKGYQVDVLFLEATNDALTRRFSETRRRHPLDHDSVGDGIAKERDLISRFKSDATWIIDTSDLNIHGLKAMVQTAFDPTRSGRMGLSLISFGFKKGVPREVDYVFDCRLLKNPHFEDDLRPLTGLDEPVIRFIEKDESWQPFIERLCGMVEFVTPLHEKEKRPMLTVGFGCTGGQHRSPAVTETVARHMRAKGYAVRVAHRELASTEESPR